MALGEEMDTDVGVYFCAWYGLYLCGGVVCRGLFSTYGTLKKDAQAYWCASFVSSVHAVVIVYLAYTAGRDLEVWSSARDDGAFFATSERSSLANRVFLGYLLSDLATSLYYNRAWSGWVENILHHVSGIACWYTLERDAFGHLFLLTALLCEATTPFVNNRWFFAQAGMKASTLYFVNGLVMTFLWFALRVVMFGWLGYRIFVLRAALYTLSLWQALVMAWSFVVGYGLQLFWFRKILKGAIKALFPPPPAVKKGFLVDAKAD